MDQVNHPGSRAVADARRPAPAGHSGAAKPQGQAPHPQPDQPSAPRTLPIWHRFWLRYLDGQMAATVRASGHHGVLADFLAAKAHRLDPPVLAVQHAAAASSLGAPRDPSSLWRAERSDAIETIPAE